LKPPRRRIAPREHLDLPTACLGVAREHPEEVGREQGRLLAAGARADLEDGVPLVVRILREEQELELGLEGVALGLVDAELLTRQLAQLGVVERCAVVVDGL
jgi:hypothetical protein